MTQVAEEAVAEAVQDNLEHYEYRAYLVAVVVVDLAEHKVFMSINIGYFKNYQ